MKRCIWIALTAGMFSVGAVQAEARPALAANELSFISLNLHGYHPMAEPNRILESRAGVRQESQSNVFFFTLEELERGQRLQLNTIAKSFNELSPDVVFLQEVGAGLPSSPKTCDEFYANPQGDIFGKNTALRIADRLNKNEALYDSALGCRGNIGWTTDSTMLSNQKVVREVNGEFQTVFDFGANPYPQGMIVEGTAILVKKPWRIVESRLTHLPIPHTNETFFFQMARIQKGDSKKWFLATNIHGGHKVRHFEQAIAVRKAMAEYIEKQTDVENFAGAFVGGDMNARLYRKSAKLSGIQGEISTVPWEIEVSSEFNYGRTAAPNAFETLRDLVWEMNIDPNYKAWASLGNDANAYARVQRAVDDYVGFVNNPLSRTFNLREILDEAVRKDRCLPSAIPLLNASCKVEGRIDMLFTSEQLSAERGYILFSDNNYVSTAGVSDHPGIYLRLKTQESL